MANLPLEIIKIARPIHWVKNLALFAALIFSGQLFLRSAQNGIFWGFWSFNFIASAIYIINDIVDAKSDRAHPIKKNRPIAAGRLSVPMAFLFSALFTGISIYIAAQLTTIFLYLVISYMLLQIIYSFFLKNTPVIDILAIASGFIIRVYAGAIIINAHLSVWFLLCVISVALFLASGKRRTELSIVGSSSGTRKSLKHYQKELLNSYVTMFANAAWMSWALFTFFESPKTTIPFWIFLAELSRTITVSKLLMITIPIVIFGIMRYQSLIFAGKSESPEKLLLTDIPLVASAMLWTGSVVWILYGGVAATLT